MSMSQEQLIIFQYLTHKSAKNRNLSLPELIATLLEHEGSSEMWYSLSELEKAEILFHTTDFMITSRDAISRGWEPPIPYTRD